jgi:signal transduction histidine kinase
MLGGMGMFILLIDVPIWLGLEPVASQAVSLSAFVLAYAGISLGVLKQRLFDLDRWWFRTWSWFFGGVVIIGLDLVLISAFQMDGHDSLLVTLALAGWLYFPLRQWLMGRLLERRDERRFDVTHIVSARDDQELTARFMHSLRQWFAPLSVERRLEALQAPRLDPLGTRLLVPAPASDGHYVCHLRNDGKSLYRTRDVEHAQQLATLGNAVHRAIVARQEGERAERARIRRDLHDDVAASIIRVIHATKDSSVVDLAKAVMRDLRNVLMALSHSPARAEDVLADLRSELSDTVERSGASMDWRVVGQAEWEFSGRQRSNVVRTLREATTNAVKHGTGTVSFRFTLSNDGFDAEVANERAPEWGASSGSGLSNIRFRMFELGGKVEIDAAPDRFRLKLWLPRGVPA